LGKHVILEMDASILALVLCAVHCDIGVSQYFLRIANSRAAGEDSDAGGRDDSILSDRERYREVFHYTFDGVGDFVRIAQTIQKHHELVSAQARDRIDIPHASPEATGNLAKERISSIMAVDVVYILETIEIDV
jgi:hypothetical protein